MGNHTQMNNNKVIILLQAIDEELYSFDNTFPCSNISLEDVTTSVENCIYMNRCIKINERHDVLNILPSRVLNSLFLKGNLLYTLYFFHSKFNTLSSSLFSLFSIF